MPYDIIRRENKYCVRNSETGDIKHCYRTRREALRLLRALYANVEDAAERADEIERERDEVYRKYHELVNMSASELERWAESPCSRKASLTRAPIRRNLHLLRTPKEEWGAKELEWAKRTISFISRMRGMPNGEPVSEGCPSARDIALMNWGYRPRAERAELVSLRFKHVACRRVDLADVERPELIWVLAMPFGVIDSYNSYFSERTDRRLDLVPEQVPVFEYHGLRGSALDAQPIGRTLKWEKRAEGWWALVELDKSDPRAERFQRAAADCMLEASVGMLRAGMYPQPPATGVYEQPTELLQAPVVELSLIVPSETGRAANEAAVGGYAFEEVRSMPCVDCEKQQNQGADALRSELESLRAQLAAMRAEMEQLAQAKAQAEEMARQERLARRREQHAQRLMQMQVPKSIVDELLDIFGDIPEGDQDRIIEVVGRLIDHVRALQPSAQTDSARAAPSPEQRAMLLTQVTKAQHALPEHQYDPQLIEADRAFVRARYASINVQR
ncbi:MAG: hypothetical protein RML84_09255 [Anaerolineae bacterium]|nr:hypothetical protein [Anaerolineae bacterium]